MHNRTWLIWWEEAIKNPERKILDLRKKRPREREKRFFTIAVLIKKHKGEGKQTRPKIEAVRPPQGTGERGGILKANSYETCGRDCFRN